VQVDPIKPTLKAPGTERLKLKCDEPLLNFAFNFNLRRYDWVPAVRSAVLVKLREVGLQGFRFRV